jgi:ubiquinone/menaquinone biosynthesis C-methylase UbiE
MEQQGFTEVRYELFLGGVTALHVGTKSVKSEK